MVEQWAARGCQTLLVANGCDTEMCARSDVAPDPTDVALPRPIAGFVGVLGGILQKFGNVPGVK